jgi:hypothetical protein
MSKSQRALAVCSQVACAALLAAGAAVAGSSVVVFQGLRHTPVGTATLRLDSANATLVVDPMDPAGGDGVAVELGEATSWSARSRVTANRTLPAVLSWNAMSDGVSISASSMRLVGDSFEIGASFSSGSRSTYSAQVYSNGVLVGAAGGVPSSAHIVVPISFCHAFGEILDCPITIEFHNTQNVVCLWKTVLKGSAPFRLPNGAVLTGNELQLVEEVRPAASYAYLFFNTMLMRSNAHSIAISSETVR